MVTKPIANLLWLDNKDFFQRNVVTNLSLNEARSNRSENLHSQNPSKPVGKFGEQLKNENQLDLT